MEQIDNTRGAYPADSMPLWQETNGRADLERAVAQLLIGLPHLFKTVIHDSQEGSATNGVGEAQARVLFALADGDRMVSDLARLFRVSDPTMTRTVDSLVERDMVQRVRDQHDRRCIYLHLTISGREAASQIHRRFVEQLIGMMHALNDDQLGDILRAGQHLMGLFTP